MHETKKRNLIRRLGYGAGYLPDPCFYQFIASFQIVFLTSIVGLSPAAAGTISAVTMLADAVFSLFIGKISDNVRSRFGRRRPFLLATSFAMPLSFAMMFRTVQSGASMAYYLFWGIIFWVAYGAFFVCYVALGADVATDYEDRIILNSYTRLFTLGGGIAGTALPLTAIAFLTGKGLSPSASWAVFTAVLAAFVCLMSLVCWRVTRGCEQKVWEDPEPLNLKGLLLDAKQLLTLRPYLKVVASKIASNFAYTFYTGALVFYIVFVLGIDSTFSSLIYLLANVFSLVLVPFIAGLSLKFGKKAYMVASQLACAAASVVCAVIGVRSKALLIAYMLVYCFGQASFWQLCNTNLYDIADLDEYRFGVRREGNITALQSFINTIFTSIFLKVLTGLLSVSGFVATASSQTASALNMLRVLFLWLPAAGALLAGAFLLTYRVNKADFTLLKEALYRRHQGMEPLPPEEIARIENMFR
ncbi:MAG: MFS transporter [Clostridia bacterium]|nr:MFS transporter [Clostridia bacterium]